MTLISDTQAYYPSLKGKVAIVTGGASGIGSVIVKQLCYQGVEVTFIDIDISKGKQLESLLTGQGCKVRFTRCDVTNVNELQQSIQNTAQALGRLDILVNNAASDERHKMDDVNEAFWDKSFQINLKPYFFASQAAYPFMKKQGGSIINLGSASWRKKQCGMPLYTTAKAAIEGLSRSLAADYGNDYIRVNTLIPGWVKTDKQLEKWLSPDLLEETQDSQCIHHTLEPLDIAKGALFLASDESKMMTAQTLIIDAGWV